jgi:hypothetical protein
VFTAGDGDDEPDAAIEDFAGDYGGGEDGEDGANALPF